MGGGAGMGGGMPMPGGMGGAGGMPMPGGMGGGMPMMMMMPMGGGMGGGKGGAGGMMMPMMPMTGKTLINDVYERLPDLMLLDIGDFFNGTFHKTVMSN